MNRYAKQAIKTATADMANLVRSKFSMSLVYKKTSA